jgi:hypothetical protein
MEVQIGSLSSPSLVSNAYDVQQQDMPHGRRPLSEMLAALAVQATPMMCCEVVSSWGQQCARRLTPTVVSCRHFHLVLGRISQL